MIPSDWTRSLEDSTLITDADRRDADRSACEEVRPVRLLVRPSFRALPAFIRNFSRRGLGLIITRPMESDSMLAMQLRRRHAGISDILTAYVRHMTRMNDKFWFIGCRLSRGLSDNERRALLHGDHVEEDYWHDMDR